MRNYVQSYMYLTLLLSLVDIGDSKQSAFELKGLCVEGNFLQVFLTHNKLGSREVQSM